MVFPPLAMKRRKDHHDVNRPPPLDATCKVVGSPKRWLLDIIVNPLPPTELSWAV